MVQLLHLGRGYSVVSFYSILTLCTSIAFSNEIDTALASSNGVVYSAEYLSELKASTRSAPAQEERPQTNPGSELVFDESEMADIRADLAAGATHPNERAQ